MSVLLLVEDDHAVAAAIVRALRDRGHEVRPVGTALDALREVSSHSEVELVILDLGLPDLDGVDALRLMRGVSEIPVVVVTARGDEASVVRLLDAGADDYLTKPFSSEHLAARINALLRRTRSQHPALGDTVSIGELRIDLAQREAFLAAERLPLTRREFDLLAYLAANAGRIVPRAELSREVWGRPPGTCEQSIDVHLSWLRRKLGESASEPRFLHTVRGVGVKLMEPACDGSPAG